MTSDEREVWLRVYEVAYLKADAKDPHGAVGWARQQANAAVECFEDRFPVETRRCEHPGPFNGLCELPIDHEGDWHMFRGARWRTNESPVETCGRCSHHRESHDDDGCTVTKCRCRVARSAVQSAGEGGPPNTQAAEPPRKSPADSTYCTCRPARVGGMCSWCGKGAAP
jgi:hypothetical protein